jgi:acylaminoacyl-peptidase
MAVETDIPDWVYAEAGLPYPFASPPRALLPESYPTLRSASPITHLYRHHLSSAVSPDSPDWVDLAAGPRPPPPPTLLLLGADDRRVPNSQGKAWLYALRQIPRARADCLVFPGAPRLTARRGLSLTLTRPRAGTGHALDSVEAEVESVRAVLDWFDQFA